MAQDVRKVLIVGGGIAGMATAIALRHAGIGVDLIDIDPEWRVLGSGVTLTAPTLRAFRQIGLYDVIARHGAVAKGVRMHRYTGEVIGDVSEPTTIDGLPASGGIMRPVLHQAMVDRMRQLKTDIRLGLTVTAIANLGERVDVEFSDTTSRSYDLVVAADGIYSKFRRLLFPLAPEPTFVGMSGWRITGPRPEGLDRVEVYTGAANLAGITPCAHDRAYMWLNDATPEKVWLDEAEQPEIALELFAGFGGNIALIRDTIGSGGHINYRPFETIILDKPWHAGRVVVVGDACHATTPQLASGAGMAVEDAIVLAEELGKTQFDISTRLVRYTERRYDRCRFVVERSVEIGDAAKRGESSKTSALFSDAMHRLSEAI